MSQYTLRKYGARRRLVVRVRGDPPRALQLSDLTAGREAKDDKNRAIERAPSDDLPRLRRGPEDLQEFQHL